MESNNGFSNGVLEFHAFNKETYLLKFSMKSGILYELLYQPEHDNT